MDVFLGWLGPVLALCIGVMILAVFFKVLGVVSDRLSPTRDIRIRGFLKQAEFVTLQMNRGETLENVRFIGFMDTRSLRGMPYQLANMVIVETKSGERILLRADGIRSIRQMSGDPGVGPDRG